MGLGQVAGAIGAGLSGFTEGMQSGADLRYKQQLMQLQQRRAELETYQGLQNAIKIPDKAMRGLVMGKLLPGIGMDPASEDGKNFIKAINGAEDETLAIFGKAFEKAGLTDIPPKMIGQMWNNDPGSLMKFIFDVAKDTRDKAQVKDILQGTEGISFTTDPKEALRSINQLELAAQRATAYGNEDALKEIRDKQDALRKVARVGARAIGIGGGQKTITATYVDEDPKSPTFGQKIVQQIPKGAGKTVLGISKAASTPPGSPGTAKYWTDLGIYAATGQKTDNPYVDKQSQQDANAIFNKIKSTPLLNQIMGGDILGGGAAPGPSAAPGIDVPPSNDTTVSGQGSGVEIAPDPSNDPSWAEQMLQQYQMDSEYQ